MKLTESEPAGGGEAPPKEPPLMRSHDGTSRIINSKNGAWRLQRRATQTFPIIRVLRRSGARAIRRLPLRPHHLHGVLPLSACSVNDVGLGLAFLRVVRDTPLTFGTISRARRPSELVSRPEAPPENRPALCSPQVRRIPSISTHSALPSVSRARNLSSAGFVLVNPDGRVADRGLVVVVLHGSGPCSFALYLPK